MIDGGKCCEDVLTQLMAVIGALGRTKCDMMQCYAKECIEKAVDDKNEGIK